MSKKYYDDFTKLTLSKMAEKISDMTYEFKNTEVPNTHYKKLLETNVLEMIAQDSSMELILLNAVVTQLKALQKESPKLFLKGLICINENINLDKINTRTYESLDNAYQLHSNDKQIINQEISNDYKECYKNHSKLIVDLDDEKELLS